MRDWLRAGRVLKRFTGTFPTLGSSTVVTREQRTREKTQTHGVPLKWTEYLPK